jgi:hypothetical protein
MTAARKLPVNRVHFEIGSPLMRSSHCHCQRCQKAHGAPFRAPAQVTAADFRFLVGEELVSFYASTLGTHRRFCNRRFCKGVRQHRCW